MDNMIKMKENANKALKLAKDVDTLVTIMLVISLLAISITMLACFLDPYTGISFVSLIIAGFSTVLIYGFMRLAIYIVELLAYANLIKADELTTNPTNENNS